RPIPSSNRYSVTFMVEYSWSALDRKSIGGENMTAHWKKVAMLMLMGLLVAGPIAPPHAVAQGTLPTIVLVHGAFVDGSSWDKVIPILQRDGYPVIAVQNPLTSFPDDVATTKRVIGGQKGPVVVVGHSYGGAVITEAAADNSHV